MFFKKLILALFGFYYFDPSRIKKNNFYEGFDNYIERNYESKKNRKNERKKILQQEFHTWKPRRKYIVKQFALKGVKPKDHRYSHQKKLRRMYRNS